MKHLFVYLTFCFFYSLPSQAVNISTEGMGQAILFPHFQVNDKSSTEISITNTTADSKAVKVRFVHPQTGEYVTGFNLYLGARDMWVGQIKKIDDKIQITTQDKSCVLKDSKELNVNWGSVEILEMGTLPKAESAKDCAKLEENWKEDGLFHKVPLKKPTGGLFARLTVVKNNSHFSFSPLILAGWSKESLHFAPSSAKPDLSDVNPKVSFVFSHKGEPVMSNWKTKKPIDPVTAVLMNVRSHFMFAANPVQNEKNDFIVNRPTLVFNKPASSCLKSEVVFVETPSSGNKKLKKQINLCDASQILSINDDRALGIKENLAVSDLDFFSGQMFLSPESSTLVSDEGHVFHGQALIGHSVYENRVLNKSMTSVKAASSERKVEVK